MGGFQGQLEPVDVCERQREAVSGFEEQLEALCGCKRQWGLWVDLGGIGSPRVNVRD